MSAQCEATQESAEFAPVLLQCQLDAGHDGDCAFPTDTDFAVLAMVADVPPWTPCSTCLGAGRLICERDKTCWGKA
jgi:hypothetical protein